MELLRRRADEALADADTLLAAGPCRGVLSRAYYAMFHLTQAMLATEDLFRRRHGAVHALFNERFVRNGRVPTEAYRWLSTASHDPS